MEVNGEEIVECKNGREVLEYLIEEKLEEDEEGDWCNYVNGMIGDSKGIWLSDKSKWDMFVIGDLDKEVFEVDFCNELNSCLVVREDSEYFKMDGEEFISEEIDCKLSEKYNYEMKLDEFSDELEEKFC